MRHRLTQEIMNVLWAVYAAGSVSALAWALWPLTKLGKK